MGGALLKEHTGTSHRKTYHMQHRDTYMQEEISLSISAHTIATLPMAQEVLTKVYRKSSQRYCIQQTLSKGGSLPYIDPIVTAVTTVGQWSTVKAAETGAVNGQSGSKVQSTTRTALFLTCQYTGITISGIRWTAQECFYLRRLRSKT